MAINNVADLLVETMEQAGVKRIFGIVGDSLNGLTEALRRRGTIDWIHVRHEEVADSLACYFLDVDTGWGVSTSAIANADALELGRKLVFTSHAA